MVTAVSRLSWLGGRGEQRAREHEGHRLTGVVIADPAVHLAGRVGAANDLEHGDTLLVDGSHQRRRRRLSGPSSSFCMGVQAALPEPAALS